MFVVVMGVSGSGKTTIARGLADRMASAMLDADDLHPPGNVTKMTDGDPLDEADRRPWLAAVGRRGAELAAAGGEVVVACSALRRAHRDVLRAHGATAFVHLTGDADTLQQRMLARRDHFMQATLLASQLATLEPTDGEPDVATFDISAPPEHVVEEAHAWLRTLR